MIHIAVVEDEKEYMEQIQTYVADYAREKGVEIQTHPFGDGLQILEGYQPVYDLILLDISMPGLNGMETARRIRAADTGVVLVFITSMAQYAINGYEVGALDFVLKPITYSAFSLRLSRALSRLRPKERSQILLTLSGGVRKLNINDIYYVEVQNRKLCYHTSQGSFEVRGTLQAAEASLKGHYFSRCNHWYLVNLHHVSEIRKNIVIVAGNELEISRRNKNAFLSALTDYVGMGI